MTDTRAAALDELAAIDAPLLDADHIPQPEPGQVWRGLGVCVERFEVMVAYRDGACGGFLTPYDGQRKPHAFTAADFVAWARGTGARPEVRGILVELSDEQLSAALTYDGSETSGDLTTFRVRPEALK